MPEIVNPFPFFMRTCTELDGSLRLGTWRENLQALFMLAMVWLAMGLALSLFPALPGWLAVKRLEAAELLVLFSALGTALLWLGAAPLSRRWLGVRPVVQPADARELRLLMHVRELARRAGVPAPRVGLVEAPLCNAFTLGFGRRSACIVVGRALLETLDDEALRAVLAHELAHIINGDLRTLAWLNSAVNLVTVQPARLIGRLVDQGLLRRPGPGFGYYTTLLLTQLSHGWLASLLSGWFSRRREFDADRTAARLVGSANLAAALERLRRLEVEQSLVCPAWVARFGLSGRWHHRLRILLMSHPALEERIRRLGET